MATKATAPAPRDYAAEMAQMQGFAQQLAEAQSAAALRTNQGMIDQALNATDTISGKLNNGYTTQALGQINSAAGQIAPMRALGDQMTGLSTQALGNVGMTEIEQQLQSQALSDLALGRSLSPEQQRATEQSARAGYAARGMAVGAPSAVAEILNRDAYSQNRLDARRAFAGTVDQANSSAVNSRMQTAGSLLGQSFGAQQNIGQMGQGLAQSYLAADPYQRALGSNIPIAGQGPSASLTNSAYGSAMNYAGDLNNTNYNAQWSNYLNGQNNSLAMQMGQMQAGSARQASNSATTGALIGAGGAIIGGVAIAF